MPDIRNAIKIVSTVSTSASTKAWGVPAIVGESLATAKNTPKKFTSLATLKVEHGEESDIYLAAAVMFRQGIQTVYTVAIDADTAGTPTADETEDALDTLLPYAASGEIEAAVLAAITGSTLLAKLKTFADAANVIFVVTHAAGETVSSIVSMAASLESTNGLFIAYKSVGSDDVACAVLGAIMARRPYYTLTWMSVDVDVDDYFSPTDLTSLETGRVNAINRYKDENRLSNGLSLDADVPFLDTTRTLYYVTDLIQTAVAEGRMAAAQVPYTQKGFEVIRGWITTPLESLVRDNAIRGYTVTMPSIDSIATEDRAARKITGISVSVQTISDIQLYEIGLNMEV